MENIKSVIRWGTVLILGTRTGKELRRDNLWRGRKGEGIECFGVTVQVVVFVSGCDEGKRL